MLSMKIYETLGTLKSGFFDLVEAEQKVVYVDSTHRRYIVNDSKHKKYPRKQKQCRYSAGR
jgi:hypothetical protein